MLPEQIHKDDIRWVREQLVRLPLPLRIRACSSYAQVWNEAHDSERLEHCKENAGRFSANSRLRGFVKKVTTQISQQ